MVVVVVVVVVVDVLFIFCRILFYCVIPSDGDSIRLTLPLLYISITSIILFYHFRYGMVENGFR
jgi:hypothetical protein